MSVQELELIRELAETYDDAERGWDEMWAPIVALDPNLAHPGIQWYLIPGLVALGDTRSWRSQGELSGVVDRSYSQPAASTSTIRRIYLEDGSARIIKEFDAHHPLFYTGSPVAQAMTLGGEQVIGGFQYDPTSTAQEETPFYQGIYSLREEGTRVRLKPYEYGDEDRVVSVMREVDRTKTLGLLLFSDQSPDTEQLKEIYHELVVRAMRMNIPMPTPLRDHFGSEKYIEIRIFEDTPGRLANRKMGGQFEWVQDEANHYLERASYVLWKDRDLLAFLLGEEYARRGGDVRAINTILDEHGGVDVILDQISLLLDRKAMGARDWSDGRLDIAPWGMNSPSYEAAFLLPDLIASRNEQVVQTVVDGLGEHVEDFLGAKWEDLSSRPIRALRFWTAMKAIETAGLSTFQIDHPDLGKEERGYLTRATEQYGGIAIKLIQELVETIS